jgi:hypothetical protein
MLKKEDVILHFKSKISADYREDLESLFYFNRNQWRYASKITQSIEEYAKPVVAEEGDELSLVFENRDLGQTLHVFDGDGPAPNLIGVIMYVRDSEKKITIVHIAMHERCKTIYRNDGINITSIVIDEVFTIFKKIKGVEKVRIYYIGKEFSLDKLMEKV